VQLGAGVHDLALHRHALSVTRFATPAAFREYFKAHYGPTIAVYRAIAADPARVAELDAALDDLARRHQDTAGAMSWEYLLVTATRT
jgi:hypothetical protein